MVNFVYVLSMLSSYDWFKSSFTLSNNIMTCAIHMYISMQLSLIWIEFIQDHSERFIMIMCELRATRYSDVCLVSIDFDEFKHYDHYLRCISKFGLYLTSDILLVGREFVDLFFFCLII